MRGEIGLHLHKDILTLPIFENATQGCLKSISLHTKRAFSAPGEFLAHKGDAINYVYLLCAGSMEVLKQDMVVAILGRYKITKGKSYLSSLTHVNKISSINSRFV